MASVRQQFYLQIPLALDVILILASWQANGQSQVLVQQCQDTDDSLSSWAQHLANLTFAPTQRLSNPNVFQHNLHSVCPAAPQTGNTGLHHVSLCPWHYETDYDYDRYPHQMMYARCTCGRCSTANGERHTCRPLHQSFQVIKKECTDGTFRYQFAYVSLPIACICSYRETHLVA